MVLGAAFLEVVFFATRPRGALATVVFFAVVFLEVAVVFLEVAVSFASAGKFMLFSFVMCGVWCDGG